MLNFLLTLLTVTALVIGFAVSTVGLYGRYHDLPPVLTGRKVCSLEADDCQELFQTPLAALLGGIPNALYGLVLYTLLFVGFILKTPTLYLLFGATLGLIMSFYLGRYLLKNTLKCRICWAAHAINLILWTSLFTRLIITG